MPVGAISAVGVGVGAYNSSKAIKAGKKASAANLAYAQEQNAMTSAAVQPYQASGAAALGKLQDPTKSFETSPGYQFRLTQGIGSVANSKAVNGLLRSGSALKAVSDYGQNTASNEFGNWWNQQKGLADQGLTGTQIASGAAQSNIGASGVNAGNQGSAAIAGANTANQAFGSIADLITKYGVGGSTPAPTGGTSSYGPAPNYQGQY